MLLGDDHWRGRTRRRGIDDKLLPSNAERSNQNKPSRKQQWHTRCQILVTVAVAMVRVAVTMMMVMVTMRMMCPHLLAP
ncbi:MAG: hypothetical protein AAF229_15540 [Pseudomonadota bacterium]